jgi:hypothetical protein
VVEWVKLSAIFFAVAMDRMSFKNFAHKQGGKCNETTVYKGGAVPTAQSNPG